MRAFVVWEPVLPTDWSSPSIAPRSRLSDVRVTQFWDQGRVISHLMGEHDRRSVVWDYIAVYPAGARWQDNTCRSSKPAIDLKKAIQSGDSDRLGLLRQDHPRTHRCITSGDKGPLWRDGVRLP